MADDASNAGACRSTYTDLNAYNSPDDRVIVWFDIDNTLYSASSKISQAMGERIHSRIRSVISVPSMPFMSQIILSA